MATKKTYENNTGVLVHRQNFDSILESVRVVLDVEILVGVPSDSTERPKGLDPQDDEGITNAAIAYIQDQGSPEAHIPQREFMRPGIEDAEADIERKLASAMRAAMRGNALVAEQAMHQAGLIAQSAIRNRIDAGIPPPLSEYTLRKRANRGRRGAMTELDRRMGGLAPSLQYAKPLVDKGELRKSITYVLRSRKKRKR